MRQTRTTDGLKVHAVAGTYVVLLGFDMPREDCEGLLGFSIHRVDHNENESYYLEGMKAFAETDPGFPAGATYLSKDQPIQSFQWADYTANPSHRYTYTISALKGTPRNLVAHTSTVLDIETEGPESGTHDVYFNRGVAGSQAYVRRFGNRAPNRVPNGKAFEWLSRGLYEALVDFVRTAEPGRHALRIAAYEFHYEPFLRIVREAVDQGVDVRIVYDARKDKPGVANRTAVQNTGLSDVCTERTDTPSYISHNKFIVKLDNGRPHCVWTGGTNYSEGGIFGHSNVAHVVEEEEVAAKFLQYWEALAGDPSMDEIKEFVETISPLPDGAPAKPTSVLFSPRSDLSALAWYARLANAAREGLFMTFAFGMHDVFKDVYANGTAPFRLALMEKKTRNFRKDQEEERIEEERKIDTLRAMSQNTFAIGEFIRTNEVDGWVKERLTGLNTNVRYVHNKFMLIDPLSDDPIVIAGSANFSDASTNKNDENMVITRGNTRVADIYLGEFMRLYSHHAFRESLKWRNRDEPPKPLRTDDWWRDYFGATERSVRRAFFARS